MNWGNLEYFLAVARTGSLSPAAKILNVNHSTVARRIDKLEEQLNIKLFKRHSQGYQLTEQGKTLEKKAIKVEEQINKIHQVFNENQNELTGTLTLSKPTSGGISLAPFLSDFRKEYPNIDLHIKSSSNNSDLSLHQADISIQLTNRPPEELIGKELGEIPLYIYGNESYMSSHAKKDINDLDWIVWVDDSGALSMEDNIRRVVDNPKIAIRTNSYSEIYDYMASGLGVSLISPFGLPNDHKLLAYKPNKYKFNMNIWLLYHPDLRNNARVLAFKKFFIEQFQLLINKK